MMSVINYYPTPHRTVEFAVAAVLVNSAVTSLLVTVRTVTPVVAPLTFVTDNELENEVISKAGLDEDTAVDFTTGVLDSSSIKGFYYIYNLSFSVTTGGC